MLVEVKFPLSATRSDVGELECRVRKELLVIVQLPDTKRTALPPRRQHNER